MEAGNPAEWAEGCGKVMPPINAQSVSNGRASRVQSSGSTFYCHRSELQLASLLAGRRGGSGPLGSARHGAAATAAATNNFQCNIHRCKQPLQHMISDATCTTRLQHRYAALGQVMKAMNHAARMPLGGNRQLSRRCSAHFDRVLTVPLRGPAVADDATA